MSAPFQPGILDDVPKASRYLSFRLLPDADPAEALGQLARSVSGRETVVGIGLSTVHRLGKSIPGLREPPPLAGPAISLPVQPRALWCWLRGDDRGVLLHRGRAISDTLRSAFRVEAAIDGFCYADSRDLSGYVDGTENPKDDKALRAAILQGAGPGLDGSSFAVAQPWLHDLARFDRFSRDEQDAIFGRRREDNEEMEEAPASAHVKRTAQESFEPEAFIVRRSMPWSEGKSAGLMFVAFAHSFDLYETLVGRMIGLEDGVTDALFRFTRPLGTSYYWCPPMRDGYLDLSALGV